MVKFFHRFMPSRPPSTPQMGASGQHRPAETPEPSAASQDFGPAPGSMSPQAFEQFMMARVDRIKANLAGAQDKIAYWNGRIGQPAAKMSTQESRRMLVELKDAHDAVPFLERRLAQVNAQKVRMAGASEAQLQAQWAEDLPWEDVYRPHNLFAADQIPGRPEPKKGFSRQFPAQGSEFRPGWAPSPSPPESASGSGSRRHRRGLAGQLRAVFGLAQDKRVQYREQVLKGLDEAELARLAATPAQYLMSQTDLWSLLHEVQGNASTRRSAQAAIHPDKINQSPRLAPHERTSHLRKAEYLRELLGKVEEA